VLDLTAYERFEPFMEEHGIDRDQWTYADFVAAVLGEEVGKCSRQPLICKPPASV